MNKFIYLFNSVLPSNYKILPNIWLLTQEFSSCVNLKYCNSYNSYWIYYGNIWQKLTNDQVQQFFLTFIQIRFPLAYTKFRLNSLSQVLILLKRDAIDLPDCKRKANSTGFLLPFLNGVFNTVTLELLPHDSSYYITHMIPLNLDFTVISLANTAMSQFLMNICNNSSKRLNILRACLYCIFTNKLSFQIALYIYGPGGTGKSTLMSILLALLGDEAALSTTISQLNSRFGTASLIDKKLVVMNDISLYKGVEPKIIKEIITGDRLTAEFKFLTPFQFTPTSFLTITSNILWDIRNATTGLARRFIYFPFDFIPSVKVANLFKTNNDGEISGILAPFLPALILWILTCPKKYLDLLKLGGLGVTQMISDDGLLTHPLQMWISEWLTSNKNGIVQIGNNKSNDRTLYGNYLVWANMNGVTPLKFNHFSNLLLDLLNSMQWKVEKKRRNSGAFISGVELRETAIMVPTMKLGTGADAITPAAFSINKNN